MKLRRGWIVILGAVILWLGPPLVASLCVWSAEKKIDKSADELLALADKVASDASSKQLLAGILLVAIVFAIVGGTVLWVMLWMIGIILLLIVLELRDMRGLMLQR
jgi:hypothetical protein